MENPIKEFKAKNIVSEVSNLQLTSQKSITDDQNNSQKNINKSSNPYSFIGTPSPVTSLKSTRKRNLPVEETNNTPQTRSTRTRRSKESDSKGDSNLRSKPKVHLQRTNSERQSLKNQPSIIEHIIKTPVAPKNNKRVSFGQKQARKLCQSVEQSPLKSLTKKNKKGEIPLQIAVIKVFMYFIAI